jgi:hypothetical protein
MAASWRKTVDGELVKDKTLLSVHQLLEQHGGVARKHENQSAFVKPVVLILL